MVKLIKKSKIVSKKVAKSKKAKSLKRSVSKKKVDKKKSVKNNKVLNSKKVLKTKTVKKVLVKNKKIAPRKKTLTKSLNKEVKLERSIKNPIITPRAYGWESRATFNPTAFVDGDNVHLIYRAVGEDDVSVLGYAKSFDGYNIHERPTYHIYKRSNLNFKEGDPLEYSSGGGWCGGCEDPRITKVGNRIYMLYTAFDGWSSVRIALTSISLDDFRSKQWNWTKPVLISPPGEMHKNWVIFPEKINGKFAIMHSFYPKILVDYFDSLDEFDEKKFIKSNNTRPVDVNRDWDSWFRGVGPSPIKTKEGWLILYHAMDHKNPDRYRLGALILDYKNPTKVLYRSSKPILEPEEHYENNGHKWGVVYSCGAVVKDGRLFVYYGGADMVVCVASVELTELLEDLKKDKVIKLKENKLQK